jgi:hypothetical protein
MKCSEAEERLLLDMSNELEPEEKALLAQHLAECRSCREAAESTCSMLEALGPPSAMPKVLEKKILAAVRIQAHEHREISPLLRIVRDFGAVAAVSIAALLLFFMLAPEPEIPGPSLPAGSEARVVERLPQEQAAVTQEEVSRAISRIGTSSTSILNGTFSQQAKQTWDNVEATRFLLTTPDRAGLGKEINSVKDKILKLRDEMTALALYTGPERQNSFLDNGR